MSEAPPLVSVVMATYHGDRLDFLGQAVDAIRRQTYSNLEFLIALDGPLPPDTDAYLEQIAAADDRVRLIRLETNRGAAAARNAAIAQARGEYIAIMDADDTCAPERIEKQLARMRESDTDVLGSFMNYIDDEGTITGRKDMFVTNAELRRTALFLNPINNPTVLAKADVLKAFLYDERFRRGHDYHLWARLIVAGRRLDNLPEYLHNLRTGADFLARRDSVYFAVVLRSLFILAGAYPWYLRPLAYVAAVFMASLRLMPRWSLRLAYRLRNALRARASK